MASAHCAGNLSILIFQKRENNPAINTGIPRTCNRVIELKMYINALYVPAQSTRSYSNELDYS